MPLSVTLALDSLSSDGIRRISCRCHLQCGEESVPLRACGANRDTNTIPSRSLVSPANASPPSTQPPPWGLYGSARLPGNYLQSVALKKCPCTDKALGPTGRSPSHQVESRCSHQLIRSGGNNPGSSSQGAGWICSSLRSESPFIQATSPKKPSVN